MTFELIITRQSGVEKKEEPTESDAEITAEDLVLEAEKNKENCQIIVIRGGEPLHAFIAMP